MNPVSKSYYTGRAPKTKSTRPSVHRTAPRASAA